MLQWFITFPEFGKFTEFLIHLGKTPMAQLASFDKSFKAVESITRIFEKYYHA